MTISSFPRYHAVHVSGAVRAENQERIFQWTFKWERSVRPRSGQRVKSAAPIAPSHLKSKIIYLYLHFADLAIS